MCAMDFKQYCMQIIRPLENSLLNGKVKALVALSGALDVHCVRCVEQIRSAARELGATDGEIAEAESIARRMKEGCINNRIPD